MQSSYVTIFCVTSLLCHFSMAHGRFRRLYSIDTPTFVCVLDRPETKQTFLTLFAPVYTLKIWRGT